MTLLVSWSTKSQSVGFLLYIVFHQCWVMKGLVCLSMPIHKTGRINLPFFVDYYTLFYRKLTYIFSPAVHCWSRSDLPLRWCLHNWHLLPGFGQTSLIVVVDFPQFINQFLIQRWILVTQLLASLQPIHLHLQQNYFLLFFNNWRVGLLLKRRLCLR